jgi:hypothetical protein
VLAGAQARYCNTHRIARNLRTCHFLNLCRIGVRSCRIHLSLLVQVLRLVDDRFSVALLWQTQWLHRYRHLAIQQHTQAGFLLQGRWLGE